MRRGAADLLRALSAPARLAAQLCRVHDVAPSVSREPAVPSFTGLCSASEHQQAALLPLFTNP